MPRGRGGPPKKSHKGQRRHFTSEEQLAADAEKEKREQQWREKRGELPSDEESGSAEESDEETKGPGKLIPVDNPNRASTKETFKVTALTTAEGEGAAPQLSRREREEVEKQQAKAHYQKLHMQGKTDEARADLARLALIRKTREEAAKKREDEKRAKQATKDAAEEKMRKKVEERRKSGK